MGITAGVSRYPVEALRRAQADGTYYPANEFTPQCDYYDLSRHWDELHPALERLGYPLTLALSGDYAPEGGLTSFGWSDDDERDHYCAWASPSLVQQIAVALASLTLRDVFPGDDLQCGHEYVQEAFTSVQRCYEQASKEGQCVFIQVT